MREVRYISLDGRKPPNVFVQALAAIVAIGIFVVSVIVGGIVLAALVGFILLMVIVVWVRFWWLRLQIERSMREQHAPATEGGGEEIVEAEYQVIDVTDEDGSKRQ